MREIFPINRPAEIGKLKAQIATLENRSDFEIQYAWQLFCEDQYCASDMVVDGQLLKEFEQWITQD